MIPTPTARNRLVLFICFIAVILFGLASRKYPSLSPGFVGKYPGDASWGLMIFVGMAFLKPRASTLRLAIMAYAFCAAIETSQLYQAPWINAIRATTLGYLVLGYTFSWFDLVAYAVGIALGAVVDFVIRARDAVES